jgi:hypothetical protein
MPSLLQVLVVNSAMLVGHANLSFIPINPKSPKLVANHMWTRQHGMDGPMSCLQVEVGHHLHPSFLPTTLTPKVMCWQNLANMVTPLTNPTTHLEFWKGV